MNFLSLPNMKCIPVFRGIETLSTPPWHVYFPHPNSYIKWFWVNDLKTKWIQLTMPQKFISNAWSFLVVRKWKNLIIDWEWSLISESISNFCKFLLFKMFERRQIGMLLLFLPFLFLLSFIYLQLDLFTLNFHMVICIKHID